MVRNKRESPVGGDLGSVPGLFCCLVCPTHIFPKHPASSQAALTRLGPQRITELTARMEYYAMLGFALNTFDVQPEQPLLPV
jgi:hypothetical protein